jgi:hypothetical protein
MLFSYAADRRADCFFLKSVLNGFGGDAAKHAQQAMPTE